MKQVKNPKAKHILQDLLPEQQDEFFDLVKEAAAEAANASTTFVWDIRRTKDSLYRHIALYILHQHGFDAKRIATELSYTRQYVNNICAQVLACLNDDENVEQHHTYHGALHSVTSAMNRLKNGNRR